MNKLFFSCALLFSAACFAQRLPGNVVPDHYTLRFTPDFASNSFTGDESIDVQVKTATKTIVLDAVEIDFKATTIKSGGRDQTATVTPNDDKESVTLHFPSEVAAGPATIHIAYVGQLNDKLRGMYRSEANHRKYVITQFEAIDARVAFPSFDEPAYKAIFDISATVDKEDTAISNGRIVSDEPAAAGKHTIRFSTTPKMSTYLVALTVGDWKCVSGEEDGIPLRVCSVPGKEEQGKFALEATKAILHFYDRYFAIKYPYGKLDQIAAPDFEAGAMENTGAIVYRESALLLDENKASVNDKKEVAMVIAHEMAHQWFGDLVTMKWWDDIWLNEGFATWMETKPVAAWKPEWKISQDEVLTSQRALETDSALNTRPIRQSAEGRQEINSLFDGIAYGKTSAVLRMLEGFLGREEFRKGVNAYLQAHAYSNATAQDFWGAMAAASGKPIDKMMPTFVTQPGVPYVDLEASCVNGETVAKLSQRRFIASPKSMQNDSKELWQLPLLMKEIGGNGKESREVFGEKQQEAKLAGCGIGVFPNVNGAGYYRYSVAPSLIASDKFKVQELSEEDQVSLVGNEGALLSAGLHNIENLMTLASKFQGVETEGAIEELGAQLKYAGRYLVTERDRPQFQAWVASVFKPTLQNIGATPVKSEPPTRSNVRADLIGILGAIADDPEAIAVAKQTVAAYMQDPTSVDATLVDASFPVAAAHGDAALYDAFLQKMKSASSPQDYYRYFHALAQFRDPALLRRTLEWSLGPEVRNQDLSIILRVLNNPYGQRIAWDFIRERYGDIQKKGGQSIVGAQAAYLAVGALCDAKSRTEAESFLAQHKVAGMDRVGRQQMERMDQCIDLRQREEPNLTKYLDKTSNASGQH
jgi:aminopeptidase N